MSYTYTNSRGNKSIDKKAAFATLVDFDEVTTCNNIRNLLNGLDSTIQTVHSEISQGALNNCHGDWYEWFIAINGWNFSLENESNLLLWLPNKTTLKITNLYEEELQYLINDLEKKVKDATSVNLITSNPDFVILNRDTVDIPDDINFKITEIKESTLEILETAYKNFLGECSFEDIVGYLSVKTSFRPDRRIQIAHEGSLMKAIYTHLQTRNWIIDPPGLKYYAAATKIEDADRESMKTVATQSITTVSRTPKSAVNEVFTCNSTSDSIRMFQEILT